MEAQDMLTPEARNELNNVPKPKVLTIREQIKLDFNACFKSRDLFTKDLLGIVLSEIQAEEGRGRKVDEIAVQTLLRKMQANLQEIGTETALKERDILNKYVAKLMPEEEIKEKISEIITEIGATSPKEMGRIMTAFATKYKGKADNAIVAKITKELLTSK